MKLAEWSKKLKRLVKIVKRADGAQCPHTEEARAACHALMEELRPTAMRLILRMLQARMICIDLRDQERQESYAILHTEEQVRDVGPVSILVWSSSVDFHGQALPTVRCPRSRHA